MGMLAQDIVTGLLPLTEMMVVSLFGGVYR